VPDDPGLLSLTVSAKSLRPLGLKKRPRAATPYLAMNTVLSVARPADSITP
jgi:hypothetical protein